MALVFLDLETTGLEPARGMILEVAALRVDAQLEPIDGFQAVIDPVKSGVRLPEMDPYVVEMHTNNGLLGELARGHSFMTVYNGLLAWLGEGTHTLAGDSVHFDYRWLLNEMPAVASKFSHRLLDVSAFRVARELRGLPPFAVTGPTVHRAAPDVLASLAKARWHLSRIAE